MATFRIEIYDNKGVTVLRKYIELHSKTVEEAARSQEIYKLKKEAKYSNMGFRIIKESD